MRLLFGISCGRLVCHTVYRKWARPWSGAYKWPLLKRVSPERSGYKDRALLAGERMLIMPNDSRSKKETIFTMEATPLKFGPGASEEAGWELKQMGVGRVMLVSDPGVVKANITGRIVELIEAEGLEVEVWDRSRVEPTDDSFQAAADFAAEGDFEGFVAVGGGSSIDTAKVSDLIATHGGEIMDYVNAPVGGGNKPPGPLKPLLAIPTTAGTGAEA